MNDEKTLSDTKKKCLGERAISTINFTRRSLPNLELNRRNQPLQTSLSCSTLIWKCWSSITFFSNFCGTDKYGDMETDTDCLNVAQAEKEMYDCIRTEEKKWELLRTKDCNDSILEDAWCTLFSPTCCAIHKKHDKRETGLLREEFRYIEILCFCTKTYYCFDSRSYKFNFISNVLNHPIIEDSVDGPMANWTKQRMQVLPTVVFEQRTSEWQLTSRKRDSITFNRNTWLRQIESLFHILSLQL